MKAEAFTKASVKLASMFAPKGKIKDEQQKESFEARDEITC